MKPSIFRPDNLQEVLTGERCHILEILNDPALPDLSLARARVEPGISTALHALEATDEVYYILEGIGSMETGDLPPREVRKGDAVFIPEGTAQRITNIGQDQLLILCICRPRFRQDYYRDLESKT